MVRLMRCCACIFSVVLVAGAHIATAQERVTELSLNDCIDHALRENLNLRQYELGLQYSDLNITQAETSFDPSLSLDVTRSKSASSNYTQYITVSSVEQEYTSMDLEFGQQLTTGANWGIGLYTTLSESNIETTKNYTSNLGFQITQPLLQGFGRDVNRANIYIARNASQQAAHNLEQQAINLVHEVDSAYWNLVYARLTLGVNELAIEQADSLLAYNTKGLELGVMTESDVLEARSALVTRQQEALDQQNLIRTYEDQLRRLLNITSEDEWDITIVPTDEPSMTPIDLDPASALELAFENRPDHKLMRRQIEQQEIGISVAKNSLKPSLDLTAQYRLNGSGEELGDQYKDLGNTDEYGWSVGLVFSYPIGNRSAKTDYQMREIDMKRSELALEYLESEIRTDIRSSIRSIEIAREQVDAARLSVEVNELKLRMEEERFRNQLTSSYYVLQYQGDLASSRNQLNRALIDYMIAVADYQQARGTILRDQNITILHEDTN